jgi:hypothetical protein
LSGEVSPQGFGLNQSLATRGPLTLEEDRFDFGTLEQLIDRGFSQVELAHGERDTHPLDPRLGKMSALWSPRFVKNRFRHALTSHALQKDRFTQNDFPRTQNEESRTPKRRLSTLSRLLKNWSFGGY